MVLILANSVEPDEMQHYAAFHLGLHCLPNYPFRVSSIQRVNLHDVKTVFVRCKQLAAYEPVHRCMRFPTMWYVRPAKPPISLRIRAVWSEPLLVA